MNSPLQALQRRWTLKLIHHSHTDLGYTERQERVERYHVQFIREALRISEKVRFGERPDWRGFCWTCETFWGVEKFLGRSTPEDRERLVQALRAGDLELSGNYLNMTELLAGDVLAPMTERAVSFGRAIGVTVDSAMTADINGYGWGYAQCLADVGIHNLLSCVHAHHGVNPLGRKQIPFWWEAPHGQKLLVWNGDHYMLGNALGLVPGAVLLGLIQDEFTHPPAPENHLQFAETRIGRYLGGLEADGYPYDFAPVALSGLMTDNAPPNCGIMDFIGAWNAQHGEQVRLEMTTLKALFENVRRQEREIPLHKGDWPDWWSDGCASTATSTKLFREAQRTLRLVKTLDSEGRYVSVEQLSCIHDQLALYAEHTWGHFASVGAPWDGSVQAIRARKETHAATAHWLACNAFDDVLEGLGEAALLPGLPLAYAIVNPHPFAVRGVARLVVHAWELPALERGAQVVDEASGTILPHQWATGDPVQTVCVFLTLEPNERRVLTLGAAPVKAAPTSRSFQQGGTDRVCDLTLEADLSGWGGPGPNAEAGVEVGEGYLRTPMVDIRWQPGEGIISWRDRLTGAELLRSDRVHAAFTPIYERTPAPPNEILSARTRMGRNRKGVNVVRRAGRLAGVKRIDQGPVFGQVELAYELPGSSSVSLLLTAYADAPRVDVAFRLNKESVWEPENLYLALPFGDSTQELWTEKAGALLRPRLDQLPGTCTDFYCVQEGVSYLSSRGSLVIATPDAPLIQLGPLSHGSRRLQGEAGSDPGLLYSWVLTNFWETNFNATLGGFYEFRYAVQWAREAWSPEDAMRFCHALTTGPVCFRVNDLPRGLQ